MRSLVIHWFLLAVALAVSAYVVPGVHVDTVSALAISAVVLGLVNALIRPILSFFSFPLTFLTLGFFYLLVNGVCFGLAALLVRGFHVSGVGAAVLGALCTSVVSTVLGWFVEDDEEREERERKARRKRRD